MALTFEGVSVSRGSDMALTDLSAHIGPGCTAVIGRNGSGKTTFLQTAAGLLPPSKGRLYWGAEAYPAVLSTLRRSLGYLPQELDFPARLTPRRLMDYLARLRFIQPVLGLNLLRRVGLEHALDIHFEELPAGDLRLFGIAQALMGEPDFIVLDELTSNLSHAERQMVFQLVRTLLTADRRRVVLFSTQFYEDVEALADCMILVEAGRLLYSGSVAAALASLNGRVFEWTVPSQSDLAGLTISRMGSVGTNLHARVIADCPPHPSAQEVTATVEDACQWFRQHSPAK